MKVPYLRLSQSALLIAYLFSAQVAFADPTGSASSYLTIGIGDTAMSISGRTSPDAFVTIADFGQVIGTTIAGSDGTFTANFPAQSPEIHKPSVYVRDIDGLYTETVIIATSLYAHFTTDVNFFMPPTFALQTPSVVQGQGELAQGRAFPDSIVSLTVDNKVSYEVVVSSDGQWSFLLPTNDLNFGTHSVFVRNYLSSGEQSTTTRKQLFTVTKGSIVITSTPQPSSPAIITPRPRPQPQQNNTAPTPKVVVRVEQPLLITPVTETRLPVTISTGTGPYTVRVDWGDGQIEEIILDGNSLPLKHRYLHPGSYDVYIYAGDSSGAYQDTKIVLTVTSIGMLFINILQLLLLFIFVIVLLEGMHKRHLRYAY